MQYLNFIITYSLYALIGGFIGYLASVVTDSRKNKQVVVTPKSVFVSGSWVHREDVQKKTDELRKRKINVTSNWTTRKNDNKTIDDYQECSKQAFEEIQKADTLIALMGDSEYAYRGTFTEIGYAIAKGYKIIIVCDGVVDHVEDKLKFSHSCMNNVFFWDSHVEHVSDLEDAVKLLNGEKVSSPFIVKQLKFKKAVA